MSYFGQEPIPVVTGGTGRSALTDHGVLVGAGTADITQLAVGNSNTVLLGNTGADPSFGAVPNGALSNSSVTLSSGNNITVTGGGPLSLGGIASFNLTGTTNNALQVGNATNSLTSLAVGATGTVLSGVTASNPAFTASPSVSGSVTAGTGITATTGAITASSGNVVITAGNLTLPNTSSTTGQIQIGGNRFIHNYGTGNTFVGSTAGNTTLTTGSATQCTCVGTAAGIAITTAVNTTGFGFNALTACTTGSSNVGVGARALAACTTGASNVGIGTIAIPANVTGSQNNGIGQGSLQIMTGGSSNQSIGFASLSQLLTGSFNIGIGNSVGTNYTGAESSNIVISNAGVTSESNVIRIGTTGAGNSQQNRCFIAGIFGVTVGVSGIPVVVDNVGQLGTVVSSARFKENIKEIDDESLSIYDLRPVTFNYRHDSSKSEHYGLIAEEVDAVVPKLVVYDSDGLPFTVRYGDLPVLLLNEIKKLKKEIESLKKHIN